MKKKILIVDNDSELQFLFAQILGDAGHETCSLLDGELALETIVKFRPDLILLDVKIGNVDGRTLCKQVKETPGMEVIPVILVSAVDHLSAALGHEGSPDEVIMKPFDLDHFLKTVRFFLKTSSNRQSGGMDHFS